MHRYCLMSMMPGSASNRLMQSLAILIAITGAVCTTTETCHGETFNVSCNSGEEIVMQSAMYGRMQLGRCITIDFGYVGCQADVLQVMDSLCSGRQTCSYDVSNLDRLSPCPVDMESYLSATFECVSVEVVSQPYCSSAIQLSTEESTGVLASAVTDTSGCGGPSSPWIVTASPGQRLNVSLLDFGWGLQSDTDPDPTPTCHAYGYVVERVAGIRTTICGGETRYRTVHLSESNTVEIVLLRHSAEMTEPAFLVTYNPVGCADLDPPAHAWVIRIGDNAKVGCEWNSHAWAVMCFNSTWLGMVGSCPAPEDVATESHSAAGKSPLLPVIISLSVLAICTVSI